MQITLRVSVPDSDDGDRIARDLVDTWLNNDGHIVISTTDASHVVEITYVKER